MSLFLAGSPVISDCTFTENAADQGGGLFNAAGDAVVTGCTFRDNNAVDDGGGMLYGDGNGAISYCLFWDNTAGRDGGGLWTSLGEATVTELARPFDVSLPAISKHLRVLERAGLLVQEKDGRVRRCHLVAEPLKDAAEWIARYQRFWEEQFGALAEYLMDFDDQNRYLFNERRNTKMLL